MVASSNVCNWLSEFIGIKIAKTYAYRLDNALKRKLDKLPLSFFDRQSYGDVLSTGVNDVDNIGHNTYGILSQAISAVVMAKTLPFSSKMPTLTLCVPKSIVRIVRGEFSIFSPSINISTKRVPHVLK